LKYDYLKYSTPLKYRYSQSPSGGFGNMFFSRFTLAFLLILILSQFSSNAFAISEEERNFLLMYFKEEEIQVISATRSLKSITRIAENVEVVTARDIELMNAHTLADVLNTINGVVVVSVNFGINTGVQIEGSRQDHVLLLIDGINFSLISGNTPDVSLIPAQIIDKVEVIKGPASSAWGSSLGGVVNVITKSPLTDSGIAGLLSGSYGEKNTGDFRAELAGRKGAFGYYLFAGRIQTGGLRHWEDSWRNGLYGKFSYDFTKDTLALLTLFYNKGFRDEGDWEIDGYKFVDRKENFLSSLALKSRLSDTLNLNVSARAALLSSDLFTTYLSYGSESTSALDDKQYGGSIKLDWKTGVHSVVFGGDFDYKREETNYLSVDPVKEKIIAVYANDTVSLGNLSVTPGLRFDHIDIGGTNFNENIVSPSLGLTYLIADKTLLRGYVARGFSVPAVAFVVPANSFPFGGPNPNLEVEKVWSYQIGAETGALKYVWLKVAAFRHDIRNAITAEYSADGSSWTYVNKSKVRRRGVEAEMKTQPFYNFTLSAAATYVKSEDVDTGEEIRNNPQYTYDVGLQYDDRKSFRALLKGRYVWWDADEYWFAKYNGFIFDINLIKSIYKRRPCEAEAFLNAHNIFNGSQYWTYELKNARRWIEGGLRVKF
jgi:vitamin B12 transporter